MAGERGYGVKRKPRKEKASLGPKALAGQWPGPCEKGSSSPRGGISKPHPRIPLPSCQPWDSGTVCRSLSVTQMFRMMGSGLPRLGNTPGANPAA